MAFYKGRKSLKITRKFMKGKLIKNRISCIYLCSYDLYSGTTIVVASSSPFSPCCRTGENLPTFSHSHVANIHWDLRLFTLTDTCTETHVVWLPTYVTYLPTCLYSLATPEKISIPRSHQPENIPAATAVLLSAFMCRMCVWGTHLNPSQIHHPC